MTYSVNTHCVKTLNLSINGLVATGNVAIHFTIFTVHRRWNFECRPSLVIILRLCFWLWEPADAWRFLFIYKFWSKNKINNRAVEFLAESVNEWCKLRTKCEYCDVESAGDALIVVDYRVSSSVCTCSRRYYARQSRRLINNDCWMVSNQRCRSNILCELWNFRTKELSFPGTKVPWVELSFLGTFVPWNFRHYPTLAPTGGWTFATYFGLFS